MRDTDLLYKYVPINKQTKKMISPNTFKFTLVSELNDIFDCKIFPNFRLQNDEDILKTLSYSSKNIKDYPNKFKRFSTIEKLKTMKKILSDDEINKSSDDFFDMWSNKFGVLSLSKRNESILMWGHYTDNFKGMCIGYNKKKLEIALYNAWENNKNTLVYLVPVKYVKKFPNDVKPDLQGQYLIKTMFKCKHIDWKYEKEIRFIYLNIIDDFSNGIIPIKENLIESITFGAKADENDIEYIIKKASSLNIEFYKAKKVPSSFKLDFERIN